MRLFDPKGYRDWPAFLLRPYLSDSMGTRLWVDTEPAALWLVNLRSAFNPVTDAEPHWEIPLVVAAGRPLDGIDQTAAGVLSNTSTTAFPNESNATPHLTAAAWTDSGAPPRVWDARLHRERAVCNRFSWSPGSVSAGTTTCRGGVAELVAAMVQERLAPSTGSAVVAFSQAIPAPGVGSIGVGSGGAMRHAIALLCEAARLQPCRAVAVRHLDKWLPRLVMSKRLCVCSSSRAFREPESQSPVSPASLVLA
jgi:hypothetical protein